ncbi:hypothetical protein DIPPA_00720 [Diplonema papillatum]|nr:hypothetical protein DIPPA_00720 [Diplonema papillatum]
MPAHVEWLAASRDFTAGLHTVKSGWGKLHRAVQAEERSSNQPGSDEERAGDGGRHASKQAALLRVAASRVASDSSWQGGCLDSGLPQLDEGSHLLASALAVMRECSTRCEGDVGKALVKETAIASKVADGAQLLVEKLRVGLPMANDETLHELAVYEAVWLTHPFLPVES